jgi:hypothetical protein
MLHRACPNLAHTLLPWKPELRLTHRCQPPSVYSKYSLTVLPWRPEVMIFVVAARVSILPQPTILKEVANRTLAANPLAMPELARPIGIIHWR